jgi:hypothetical protein
MSGPLKLYTVPEDQKEAPGIMVAGGWHAFLDHPEHGRVAAMPPTGDYTALERLGFAPVPVPTPVAADAASEVLAGQPADPQ